MQHPAPATICQWTGIVLAETLIGFQRTTLAGAYLQKAFLSDNLMVRLQAMETIVETGLLNPAMKPAIAALIPEDPAQRPYDARMARYVIEQYEATAAAGESNE